MYKYLHSLGMFQIVLAEPILIRFWLLKFILDLLSKDKFLLSVSKLLSKSLSVFL